MYESKAKKMNVKKNNMTAAQANIYKKLTPGKKSAFRKTLESATFRSLSPAKRAAIVQRFSK